MDKIYKAYDIRGIYPTQLNEEIIKKIGKSFADLIIKEVKSEEKNIVVSKDMRLSSPDLTEALIEGILEQGVNVIDIGLCSTPTFYYGVSFLAADGGMQVSASHNPKEYNGIKIVKRKAYPVGYDNGINIIEKKVDNNDFLFSIKRGKIKEYKNILEHEIEFSLKQAKTNINNLKPLKVVADAANSMGALYLEELFKKLPCKLIEMNFNLDGTFPAHEADPYKEKNISDLKKRVIIENADIGIATDGDGDRVFFIDDCGKMVEPSIVRAILSRIVLKEIPGAVICYDIRPGKITRDTIIQYGGVPIITKVGHSLIKAKAIEENAEFAGESSGHFFFNTDMGLFEMPMIVILKILEDISLSGKKLSEIVSPLKKYFHSGEISYKVENKDKAIRDIEEHFKDGKIITLDGITIEYDDFWFNVRPSNTEPVLRLNLESISDEVMKKRLNEVESIIKK